MAEEKKTTENPLIGTKVTAVPKEPAEIGIDTDETLLSNIVSAAINSNIDISKLEGFSTVSQNREYIYRLIDTMSEDPILASYLKTVAEDAVETNDAGQIIWAESDDANCGKYVSYLLDSMNVDKNAYRWMHSLIKYGDLYLRLYRQSDYEKEDELFDKEKIDEREKLNEGLNLDSIDEGLDPVKDAEKVEALKENVNVVLHEQGDHYVNYVEMVPNPGEMFELTKFGKTMGFVKAPINIQYSKQSDMMYNSLLQYKLRKRDIDVYGATDFVHACLEDNSSRVPEEVDIFTNDDDYKNNTGARTYKVKRGQSELATVFKIWRQLTLLEDSALLNRITKSSILRIVNVEVGNMPKEQIGAHLQSIKQLMEQKISLDKDHSMTEYNNPAPVENFIYAPTHGGIGNITTTTVGGDFDPKQFTDIDHFQDKLFGALGVPKAFFGVTDDGAGFNGGTSLSIQSSRYGKSVKRVQNTMCQMITDLVNLMLMDRKLYGYVNKFTIRMQAPVTQEELDRRENKKNKVGVINDIMVQLADIQDPVIKLKILKSLLAESIADTEVVSLLQDYIDSLENEVEEGKEPETSGEGPTELSPETPPEEEGGELPPPSEEVPPTEEAPSTEDEESYLPSFDELGVPDGTDNSQF